jgi:hypothetical protein
MKRAMGVGVVRLLMTLLVCLPAVNGVKASAQVGATGAIVGVITDPTGAAIRSVEIVAQEKATGLKREAASDEAGRYRLPALPVGEYTLTFRMEGFKQLVRQGVLVDAAATRTVDIELALGEINQTVRVTEDAPLLQTTQATTLRQINALELLEVPSSTRNFTHLLSAEAGVNADLPPVLGNDTGSISPSVNGTRVTSNSLQFNGIDATNILTNEGSLIENISPAPETIQEVKLQTSLYDASTGRNGGGNFQIITRGGSNDLHGSLYWYVQNEAFNANDFFFNRDGISKPAARRNEAGFTLGGPIVREKAYFFGGYQRTQALTAFVPTASSTVDLPQGLDFVTGPRTAASLLAGFNAARAACGRAPLAITVAPVAENLFGVVNPVTSNFIIPAPNRALDCANGVAGAGQRFDADGNPVVRVRQVQPSEFFQDQFTVRNDVNLTPANRLNAVFFFSNFPSLDSFPDPSSLASPFTLRRGNRARTLALGNTHVFNTHWVNEARFGFLFLNNTRSLDDPFLAITNDSVGIPNPAQLFDDSPGTRRLGHFVFRGIRHSFGGPNDSFNKRRQFTWNVSDTLSFHRGRHALRFGVEWRRHNVQNDLPEEQATEFEKFDSFTQLLRGLATEADTQYGITAKEFNSTDLAWFVADDWKLTSRLTLNLGLRWDWFGWPVERNGLVGNFYPDIANTENPISGIVVPSHAKLTGIAAIDTTIQQTARASTRHTLRGQDYNNFQPRVGFAWQPFSSHRLVLRGGYGIFYDRPSAAFINTLFSNYPHLREIEVTFPSGAVPIATAFSQQPTNLPFSGWFPMRVTFESPGSASGNYRVRDNTGVLFGANGTTPNPPCETFTICPGNVAETLEFRAVDRNLRTPYIQQWNFGYQFEINRNLVWEVRYAGSKGTRLLNALALAQSFDLNDPAAPDYVFARLNNAYLRGGAPRGALGAAGIPAGLPANPCPGNQPSCLAGVGRAFGFAYPNQPGFGVLAGKFDLNLGRVPSTPTTSAIIPFEVRAVYLGMNVPEAIILHSSGNSIYHALQTSLTHRLSRGLQFNAGYTLSRSIDDSSADPGSTAGGGKPDVPNSGFIVQGDSRNTRPNRALSDFDRTHRLSLSFVYDLPTGGRDSRWLRGWQVAGFVQAQSGAPYTIFAAEPEAATAAHLLDLTRGSGGLFRLGFGRPNIAAGSTLSSLTNTGDRLTAFNRAALESPLGNFGNLGRNVLRGGVQKRFDMAISKSTKIGERFSTEFRTEFFNLFNNVNFALPVNDLQDSSAGQIENTIGGPRVIQFGLKIVF